MILGAPLRSRTRTLISSAVNGLLIIALRARARESWAVRERVEESLGLLAVAEGADVPRERRWISLSWTGWSAELLAAVVSLR